MNKDDKNIRISVRNLVEFILRSGDIDNRQGNKSDKDAMQAGSKMHRKIQKQMGLEYHAEYPLKIQIEKPDFTITLEGRADGIIIEETNVTIDEIKGVYFDLNHLTEPIEVHRAQAMCYGYIYGSQEGLSQIDIQLTYCNLDTEQKKYFKETIEFQTLEKWFLDLMEEYYKWAQFQYEWRITRNESIRPIEFPFPYREGQRNLAASVYTSINRKKRLFIQAPTGVGKTMSTVFPTIKAIGEGLGEKIFYLTAKTITRTVAEEAFDILKQNGLRGKVVTLTAKDKLCLCEETDCNPVNCPYAKGHYDRVNEAVFAMISECDTFSREVIEEYAIKYEVCPFETSLDVSLWCDVIICDYNYVFDPKVSLKRFFSEGVKGEYLFLVDEAHNLVDRGREMYSASLYKEDILELKKEVKFYSRKLEKYLEKCNKDLLEWKRECDTYKLIESISAFALNLMTLAAEIEKFLEENKERDIGEKVLDFYFQVRHFLNMYERLDENYVIYTEHEEDGRFKIKLFCINPSKNLLECLNKGNSTVFFSATLLPVLYYKELLSGDKEDYAVYANSPFPEENRLILIGKDISSKYTRRNALEYQRAADYVEQAVKEQAGNYLVFFPSYSYMRAVYEYMETKEINCICQKQGMNEKEREEFLEHFTDSKEEIVGFCVMGGIFSEGIDLKNDSLIGVLIIGTGLPQISNEKEILKNYFDAKGENGFDYAYRFPGMNKVLQAAGRVIRTTEDKGVILLLDDRFHTRQYKELFPREWKQTPACTVSDVGVQIQTFWNAIRNNR
ncbi:ATP-dependent DNA helicase [Konateibacter massiliensis]|uniref:ATP-dependent DNA helicase n=1 Tax=Konateibacter massiliensis TaxID=2002841 RepID=UPI000C15CF6A|nr:ATP-dependent DNA helicase [Konateibacter massiliensis]